MKLWSDTLVLIDLISDKDVFFLRESRKQMLLTDASVDSSRGETIKRQQIHNTGINKERIKTGATRKEKVSIGRIYTVKTRKKRMRKPNINGEKRCEPGQREDV